MIPIEDHHAAYQSYSWGKSSEKKQKTKCLLIQTTTNYLLIFSQGQHSSETIVKLNKFFIANIKTHS